MSRGHKTNGILENVSQLNLGKLIATLIHPDRVLTPAEKQLADAVMNEIL